LGHDVDVERLRRQRRRPNKVVEITDDIGATTSRVRRRTSRSASSPGRRTDGVPRVAFVE